MTMTFSLSSTTVQPAPMATISARQLATFRYFLKVEGIKREDSFIDPPLEDGEPLSYNFEGRVCPFALATISRIFQFDCDVIAVIEEAQFQGKRVLFWRDAPGGNIRMRVSQTSDDGRELQLANSNGIALLRALGIEADYAGTLPVEDVRALLLDDETRRRIEDHGLGSYADRLIQLIGDAPTSSDETLMT